MREDSWARGWRLAFLSGPFQVWDLRTPPGSLCLAWPASQPLPESSRWRPCEEGLSTPIPHVKKLKLGEVKQPIQRHTESGEELEMNPGLPDMQPRKCFPRASTSLAKAFLISYIGPAGTGWQEDPKLPARHVQGHTANGERAGVEARLFPQSPHSEKGKLVGEQESCAMLALP